MNICVYCGSASGKDPIYAEVAHQVGTTIASRGDSLVYGGGSVGLMGIVARAALAGGATVTGIIPTLLCTDEVALRECTELIEVPTMHVRKQLMIDRSDIVVALPGGYGTMDELFEAITWKQLGIHNLPIVILNVNGYYDGLIKTLQSFVDEGFVRPQHAKLFTVQDTF